MTDEQFQVLVGLLMDIRDALVAPDVESDACPHEHTISLATPAQPDHWICAACRYEHGAMTN